ncbi:MAG: large conductance mechanosensitive channel protein MscL [Clostridiales bacterium]|nr:large conductance mechanosensitive channel protein MscL [Clostridiales bacterium]
MKKPKLGLLKEFKEFITRGNVIDLAVGMIIGAAFTAIVTALVNGVFKPLIDAIPMGDLSGLITMLVPAYTETGAYDLANSVYINWGELIMAIINFLLTAVILFAIIKLINSLRGGVGKATQPINISKEEKAELKAQGMNRKQIKEYVAKREAEEAAKAAEEAALNAPESTEQILKDIRELLKSLRPQQAAAIEQAVEAAVDEK